MTSENLAVLFPGPNPALSPARATLADRLAEDMEARAAPPRIRAALGKLADVGSNHTRLLSEATSQTADRIDALANWALGTGSEPAPVPTAGADRTGLDLAEAEAHVARQVRSRLETDLAKAERRAVEMAAKVDDALTAVVIEELHGAAERITREQTRLRSEVQRLASLAGYADSLAAKGIASGSPGGRLNHISARRLDYAAYGLRQPQHTDLLPVSESAAAHRDIDGFMARLRADVTAKFEEGE